MRDMETPSDEVAAKIRDARKVLGLTMAELAERSGLSRNIVSDIENGRTGSGRKGRRAVTIDELVVISRALGCAPAALLPDRPAPDVIEAVATSTRPLAERVAELESELRSLRGGLRRLLAAGDDNAPPV